MTLNRNTIKEKVKFIFDGVTLQAVLISLIGSAILAFGLYNIHSISNVTEGGILGLTLLIEYWLGISPSVSGFILNMLCYAMGWKLFGKNFLVYSIISSGGFSFFYMIFEQFEPIYPQIAQMPLVAAIVGAIFVGVSAGMCVCVGGAPGGDDALAMSITKLTKMKIQWSYMICDLVVLGLSLSYIPLNKIIYSLITVTISGQIIGLMQKIKINGATVDSWSAAPEN